MCIEKYLYSALNQPAAIFGTNHNYL